MQVTFRVTKPPHSSMRKIAPTEPLRTRDLVYPLFIRASLETRALYCARRPRVHMPPSLSGKFLVTLGNAGGILGLKALLGGRRGGAHCHYRSCREYGCYSDDQLHCR